MTNREAGLQMLRWWYGASSLQMKGISFDQAVDFLTTKSEPRRLYLDIWGENLKVVGAYKAEDAMYSLGEDNPGKIPDPQIFSDVLYDRVDTSNVSNFVEIAGESIASSARQITTAVADYGTFGLKSIYWIAIAGVAVYVLTAARRRA